MASFLKKQRAGDLIEKGTAYFDANKDIFSKCCETEINTGSTARFDNKSYSDRYANKTYFDWFENKTPVLNLGTEAVLIKTLIENFETSMKSKKNYYEKKNKKKKTPESQKPL